MIAMLVWWLFGTGLMLWLSRHAGKLTWGRLFICTVFGFCGPALWLIERAVMLTSAQFWDKPVFPRKTAR